MDPEKAKRAYPELDERVRQVFLEHDPDQLFALGAPTDEYDGDIHALISALRTATSVRDVESALDHLFRFGPERGGQGSSQTLQSHSGREP